MFNFLSHVLLVQLNKAIVAEPGAVLLYKISNLLKFLPPHNQVSGMVKCAHYIPCHTSFQLEHVCIICVCILFVDYRNSNTM